MNLNTTKFGFRFISSSIAASVLALSATAQVPVNPATDRDQDVRTATQQTGSDRTADVRTDTLRTPRADRLNSAAKASDVIGMVVKNKQDESLGRVNEIALDLESGRIVQVILSTGGIFGIGDTLTAIPPSALHHDVAQGVLHLDSTLENLRNSPRFEMNKWAESSDYTHVSEVYRRHGAADSLSFVDQGRDTFDSASTTERGARVTSDPVTSRSTDRNWTQDRQPQQGDRKSMIPASRLAQLRKASEVMGSDVKNRQDQSLGEVENLLLDMASGRIVALVVSSGGFLGIGDELSAIPPNAFRLTPDREGLVLDTTKEKLAAAPHFNARQWPDFSQPAYTDGIYRAHQVEPYFSTNGVTEMDNNRRYVRDRDVSTNAATNPDNAARNVRDRNDRTLTPFDQGDSDTDVDITARIRKGIVDNKSMSVNARNVKIITRDGRVTLRGPVGTAQEKNAIGEIANGIARATNVDNQLEVK